MKYKDYYAALGVPRDADDEAIKKAYRKLARQYHPDVSKESGAEARFKEVAEAYQTLKDPEKRAAYDALGQRPEGQDFTPPPQWEQGFHGHFDPGSFEDLDIADLLASLSGGRHGRTRGPRRGRDLDAVARVTLEQAHRGATLHLQLDTGAGPRTLEVTVPAGVRQGQKLRLKGQGAPGVQGGEAGDIYLHIEFAPHPHWRVDGHDLYFDLPLSPWEAALGAEVEVPTLDGAVVLTVPAGTQSSQKLRIRGRGLANSHGGRGDLYAVAHIDVPRHVSDRERELFGDLAKASSFNARAHWPKGAQA